MLINHIIYFFHRNKDMSLVLIHVTIAKVPMHNEFPGIHINFQLNWKTQMASVVSKLNLLCGFPHPLRKT